MSSKRRCNGEGSICLRQDGRWMGRYKVKTPAGKNQCRAVYGSTKNETAAKLREAIRMAELGQDINKPTETLEQFYGYWLEVIASNELKPTTIQSYDQLFRKWILPAIGKKKLNKLNTTDIQAMIHGVSQQTGAKTCKNCREALSSVLHSALNLEKIITNPARKVSLPKYAPKEKELWNDYELKTFLETADKISPYATAYKILACCGLRRGEVLGLRKEDIDFENFILKVRQQIVLVDNRPTIQSLKTKSSKRDIPIPSQLCQEISVKIHGDTTENDLIFHTKTNSPISPNNFARDFKKTIRNAGVKKISMHALRHMACTNMAKCGSDIKTVQEIMGHSSPQITIEVYQHSNMNDKKKAIDTYGKMLGYI